MTYVIIALVVIAGLFSWALLNRHRRQNSRRSNRRIQTRNTRSSNNTPRVKRAAQSAANVRSKESEVIAEPEAVAHEGDDSDSILGLNTSEEAEVEEKENYVPGPVIVLHLVAPAKRNYQGYELLQCLLSAGLRFGKQKIFHRHETKNGRGPVWFSLASAQRPGTFELSKIGGYSCPGLTLFMELQASFDVQTAFDCMLETAKQLQEDLGGDLLDAEQRNLSMDKVKALRAEVRNFEESQRVPDLFEHMED